MKKINIRASLLVSALVLSASASSAAMLTINSVTGVWQNTANADGNAVSSEGTNAISWGVVDDDESQSGYVFTGAAPAAFDATEGVDFTLGTFTHNNFPVDPPSLDYADLLVTINVAGHGDIMTTFKFDHTETPNGADPCAFGGNGGINSNGCADKVEATLNLGSSDTFTIDDIEYVFDVSGFEVGGSAFDDFLTREGQSNNAFLIASFVARDSLTAVPLPASGMLMFAGLGLAGYVGRRKNKQAA